MVNHKKVHRIMKKLGLQAVIRRKKSYKNYREKSAGFKYENTFNREFHTEKPNEKWVTDITEFKVHHQPID
ncbi:hypothetical protein B6A27_08750 [Anoxybacillus sp. UARK-01]|nr:hypothetical protein B6A27_08750 [Anoxybacillus sp. UARK-01]